MRAKRVQDGAGHVYGVRINCPGCGEYHVLPTEPGNRDSWSFNGDLERPTLSPSVLSRSGHYIPGHKAGDSCWCTFEREEGEASPFKCGICHSYVRDGRIQFLSDCTHALAGQTVDLPEIE